MNWVYVGRGSQVYSQVKKKSGQWLALAESTVLDVGEGAPPPRPVKPEQNPLPDQSMVGYYTAACKEPDLVVFYSRPATAVVAAAAVAPPPHAPEAVERVRQSARREAAHAAKQVQAALGTAAVERTAAAHAVRVSPASMTSTPATTAAIDGAAAEAAETATEVVPSNRWNVDPHKMAGSYTRLMAGLAENEVAVAAAAKVASEVTTKPVPQPEAAVSRVAAEPKNHEEADPRHNCSSAAQRRADAAAAAKANAKAESTGPLYELDSSAVPSLSAGIPSALRMYLDPMIQRSLPQREAEPEISAMPVDDDPFESSPPS